MPIRSIAIFVAAAFYWWAVGRVAGVAEPWDAPAYWTIAYPLALALSAIVGMRGGWIAGALLIFAQLPVMLIGAGADPLLPVGLIFLALLTIPAAAIATFARRISRRYADRR